jgi:hypothetical protein
MPQSVDLAASVSTRLVALAEVDTSPIYGQETEKALERQVGLQSHNFVT